MFGGPGCCGLVLALLLGGVSQRQPSVHDVMKRVGAYVDRYGESTSAIVARERFEQHVEGAADLSAQKRTVVAEFAIVKVAGSPGYVGFRDVLEVDGLALADREDRLIRSLSAAGDIREAQRLSEESARFNIGMMHRNFNVPTSILFFFRSDNLDRFKFAARDVASDGTWHIAYRETDRPTMIRTPEGKSIPAEGDLWVRPDDGVVMRTLLRASVPGGKGEEGSSVIDVIFSFWAPLDMWLPAGMTETYTTRQDGRIVQQANGSAGYSNYRRFTTSGRVK